MNYRSIKPYKRLKMYTHTHTQKQTKNGSVIGLYASVFVLCFCSIQLLKAFLFFVFILHIFNLFVF